MGAMVRDELENNRDKELQLEIVAAVLQGIKPLKVVANDSVHSTRLDFVS